MDIPEDFQVKLKRVEKDLITKIIYSPAKEKLYLVTCSEEYYSTATGDESYKTPLCSLMLGSDYLFYPVVRLYIDQGVEDIFIEMTSAGKVFNLRELGDAYLSFREVSNLRRALIKQFSLTEIYNHIEQILDLFVRLITKSGTLVSEYPNQSYFGLVVTAEECPILFVKPGALDLGIQVREDFKNRLPTINKIIQQNRYCQIQ